MRRTASLRMAVITLAVATALAAAPAGAAVATNPDEKRPSDELDDLEDRVDVDGPPPPCEALDRVLPSQVIHPPREPQAPSVTVDPCIEAPDPCPRPADSDADEGGAEVPDPDPGPLLEPREPCSP